METKSKISAKLLTEIKDAQKQRADKLQSDDRFGQWVKRVRKKYIADAFLMPLYAPDGSYSRSRKRVSQFGDFILPSEMGGQVFYKEASPTWIRQESVWFWAYLISGQQAIYSNELSKLPDHIRLDDRPTDAVWREIVSITTDLGYFGEAGGGMLLPLRDLDGDQLNKVGDNKGLQEGENGYLDPYPRPAQPLWIDLFQDYEQIESPDLTLEVRPAWFHLARYAFFNIPITRLPVFCGLFDNEGTIGLVQVLDDGLSGTARELIGSTLFSLPVEVLKHLDGSAARRERQEMTCWLWYKVGHNEYKRPLSYGEIANIEGVPRSSVQTAIGRFNRRLKEKLTGKLLGSVLVIASSLGLGNNLTYNTLVDLGLVPKRERELDSFDELDKLI